MVLGLQPPYPFDANVHGGRSPRWGVRRVPTSLPVGGPHKGSGGTAFAEGQKGGAGFASEILTHRVLAPTDTEHKRRGGSDVEASTIWRESRNGYFAFGGKVEMAILLLAGK